MRNDTYLKELGAKIKTIRLSKNVFQTTLAKMCNLKRGTICEIECGKKNPHILTLKTIADALRVDVKEFL